MNTDNQDQQAGDEKTTWRDALMGLTIFAIPILVIFAAGLVYIAVLFVLYLMGVI